MANYRLLTNGLLIQWGKQSGTYVYHAYPISFVSFGIPVIQNYGDTDNSSETIILRMFDRGGFAYDAHKDRAVTFIAIGI